MTGNPQHFNLITSFEDIKARPNFIERIVIPKGEAVEGVLNDLVGYYYFRDEVKCGISSCGTKHQKGYIASLNDGHEIIIGHNCGKRYFGISFDEKTTQFEHLKSNANQYVQIKDMFEKLQLLKDNLERILNQSGKLTFLQIKAAIKDFRENALDYWMRKVIDREVSSNGLIYIDEFKTIDEIKAEKLMGKTYIRDIKRVLVGNVRDYDVIANWHNAERAKSYFDILYRELIHPNQMSGETIKRVSKKLRSHDQYLRELEEFCIKGNRLFTAENLIQLSVLFTKPHEKKIVEKYANRFA
ncbi:hypothetical protein [Acinetobacter radioresistens]|uniref:hypothetical protein n=1 Tax=Acinetobacter radioresistens TaxID=40216 RepID=UPI000EE92E2C|nr:hypothetical protein [Acinetobacter radioresistens]MCX0335040.1 hypothetical protein [Acinetobacter radioresistens]HAD69755.1 hypothetical protein [Acinetobacter radioresistens]